MKDCHKIAFNQLRASARGWLNAYWYFPVLIESKLRSNPLFLCTPCPKTGFHFSGSAYPPVLYNDNLCTIGYTGIEIDNVLIEQAHATA